MTHKQALGTHKAESELDIRWQPIWSNTRTDCQTTRLLDSDDDKVISRTKLHSTNSFWQSQMTTRLCCH